MSCNTSKTTNEEAFEFAHLNYNLPIDVRIDSLIAQMTLPEKASQLMYESPAIERLRIPEHNWWNECLHGVARAGKATVFPQAIGMSASFDVQLMGRVADAISDEARAKHHEAIKRGKRGIYQGLSFWTPNINIFRDPRWGRGMETYGEDPYLTGEMAVSFINGLQGTDPNHLKLIATAKHFVVHSGPESSRHSFNALVSNRDLYDTYLPHFRKTIERSNVQSVMCAYNRLDGEACCGSGALLNDLLRKQWGFEGYVVSDCWALVDFYKGHFVSKDSIQASALAIKSGTDLNCGSVFPNLIPAMEQGLIVEADIDRALKRLLKARFKLGMFDPDSLVKYANIPYQTVCSDEHSKLALEMTQKSMVLLKNKENTLPLSKNINTIAVIGPNANDPEVLLGNYNGLPLKPITPLQGILDKVGKNTKVLFAQGCELAEGLPALEVVPSDVLFTDESKSTAGLKAEFFNNISCEGESELIRTDAQIDFNWWDKSPVPQINDDNFSIRWTGVLVPKNTGSYYLGAEGANGFTVKVDGKEIAHFFDRHTFAKRYSKIQLEAGKSYAIEVLFHNTERTALMRLLWATPKGDLNNEAVEIAKKADAVVMVLGLSPRLEGEEMEVKIAGFDGGDRVSLNLPSTQIELMKKLKATGKPLILVLLNGSAVAINWAAENADAILEAWYPGQAGGTAIANVLFGDYNPAGRLPVTFYKSENDIPAFDDYSMKGRTYRYFEGEALYPFGYGLSYATFNYSDIELSSSEIPTDGNSVARVTLKNTSNVAGDEVVQFYLKSLESTIERPLKELKAFKRIHLAAGESKIVEFDICEDNLKYAVSPTDFTVEPGRYEVFIGGSSAERDLKSSFISVK